MSTYLDPARGSRESAAMRILAFIWVVMMWLFTGGFITLMAVAANNSRFGLELPAWAKMFEELIGFVPFFIAALMVPMIYGRKIITGVSSASSFRWKIYLHGIWTWGLLLAISGIASYAMAPDSVHFHFSAQTFFPALLVGIVLLPLQTGAEEIFFRGVIPQSVSSFLKKPVVITLVSATIFAALHLANPEAEAQPLLAFLTYFLMAFGWGWATFKTAGLEISLGAHLINNVFGLFILGYDNSVIAGASVWSVPAVDLAMAPVSAAITMLVWLALVRRVLRKELNS